MDNVKRNFNDLYEYCCMKHFMSGNSPTGLLIVDQRGRKHFESYRGQDINKNLIDAVKYLKSKKQNKIDFSNSVAYIIGDANEKVLIHFLTLTNGMVTYLLLKNTEYISKDFLSNYTSVLLFEFSNYINESEYEVWWTDRMYKECYDIVKDRKFPVTIPGYNRPSLPTLWNLRVNEYNEDCNWDFYVIVRESQREMYEEATKDFKYVTIKSFPDEIINNAGAVRRTTQKWLYSKGVKATFQMDDDVSSLSYTRAGLKEDGVPKSDYVNHSIKRNPEFNSARVFAMWQVAMEKAMASDNVLISCGQQIAFSWKDDYCLSSKSYRLMRGPMTQVVCFNIEGLMNEKIFHNNNADVGFDDIDFTLRVIESGNRACCFPWLVYGCEALGGGNGDQVSEDKLKARFKSNQDKLKSIHDSKPYVSFRPKRNLDQVCIKWNSARKYCAELNGYDYDKFLNHSEYNIWQGGKLLDEARSFSYEVVSDYREDK